MRTTFSMKKRPQYVETLLKSVNKRLRDFKVKDESDNLFVFMCDYLLKKNMYRGFNFYYLKDGKAFLAGSRFYTGEWDCLQIW